MQETNVRFYVVCDTSASMNYRGANAWGSKLECARVLAAALTWFLLKQNDAAGMVSLGSRMSDPLTPAPLPFRRGEGELMEKGASVPEFIRPSQLPNQSGVTF